MSEISCIIMNLEKALVSQSGDIPPATLSILKDFARHNIVLGLSSSRSLSWMQRFIEQCSLQSLFSFLIGSDGCEYQNLQTGAITNLDELNQEDLKATLNRIGALPISTGVLWKENYYFNRIGFFAVTFALSRHRRLHTGLFSALPQDAKFHKFVLTGSKALLSRVCSRFKVPGLKLFRQGDHLVDVVSDQTDIYKALSLAKEDFGLKDDEILYFGQEMQDVEAMKHTFGIAMRSSSKPVLESAKRVTKYNSGQNGVGYMLNVILMENQILFRENPIVREYRKTHQPKQN